MPTLTRIIIIVLSIGLLFFGVMFGLVAWVRPATTELTIDIPASTINPRPWPVKPGATPPADDKVKGDGAKDGGAKDDAADE